MYTEAYGDRLWRASRDGAATWGYSAAASTGVVPSMAVDAEGGLHAVYLDGADSSWGNAIYQYLPPTGSARITVLDDLAGRFGGVGIAEHAAAVQVDRRGGVHAAWVNVADLEVKYGYRACGEPALIP